MWTPILTPTGPCNNPNTTILLHFLRKCLGSLKFITGSPKISPKFLQPLCTNYLIVIWNILTPTGHYKNPNIAILWDFLKKCSGILKFITGSPKISKNPPKFRQFDIWNILNSTKLTNNPDITKLWILSTTFLDCLKFIIDFSKISLKVL